MASCPKVLIADDSPTFQKILKLHILKHLPNAEFICVSNGLDALEILLREEISIGFLDWHMPGLEGTEVVKKVRAMKDLKSLPLVMVTSERSRSLIKEMIDLHELTDYILKPYTTQVLDEHLASILSSPI